MRSLWNISSWCHLKIEVRPSQVSILSTHLGECIIMVSVTGRALLVKNRTGDGGRGGGTDLFTHNSRCGPGSLYYCYYSQVWSATSNNTHAREGIINEEITSLKENKEKIKIKNLISVLKMGTKSLLLLHLTVGRKMLATDGLHFCRSNHASIVQRGGGKSWFVFISFFRFWLLMKKENTSFMIYQIALKTYSNPKPFCGNWNF